MELNYGLDRVVEPAGIFPSLAWKLDNTRTLRERELAVSLDQIIIEWLSFQQICASCDYDEDRIRARIFDLIDKRGKLQNPVTKSGGVLIGNVEEIGPDFHNPRELKAGDRVFCMSSLTSFPVCLDEIFEIDYNYGVVKCSGYAIMFETTLLYKRTARIDDRMVLATMDMVGALHGASMVAMERQIESCAIIGTNLHQMMLFASMIREIVGPDYHLIGIVDSTYNLDIPREEIRKTLYPIFRHVEFVDFRQPIHEYERIREEIPGFEPVDMVIATDDIKGIETVGVLMVKENGCMYFSSYDNNYSDAIFVAESLGKFVVTYALDENETTENDFHFQVLQPIYPKLKEIDRLYEKYSRPKLMFLSRMSGLANELEGKHDGFVFQDIATRDMVMEAINVARYDCSVIIQGETGVGKEKVLELLHQNSSRYAKPCIRINCATIQESLAESEFFGYEAGAFTGAQAKGKAGYFELANEGILFLDEIGTLSLNMQSKLLRVIQENQFYRVGGVQPVNVNVRVICANNVPLRQLVEEGKFREDLYYRLNICTINVPPLRERKDDIRVLAEAFMKRCNRQYGTSKELSPEALSALTDYYWPGNVRELENVVHRLVIHSREMLITASDVDTLLNESAYGDLKKNTQNRFDRNTEKLDFRQLMEQREKEIIEYALKKEGSTRKAAEYLGMPQTTLARKKLKYNL